MLIQVHREYNLLLPLEVQEQDEDWSDDIDEQMMSFKNKIYYWLRDTEYEKKKTIVIQIRKCNF